MDFCDLNKQYNYLKENIELSIKRVLEHGQFINGPEILELENKLANYTKTKYAIGISSGTDALIISLMGLGIGRDDYVITVPFTFAANIEAILLVGAKPIFIDVDLNNFTIDLDKLMKFIENPIDPKTGENIKNKIKAIIAVDLFGQIVDYGKIYEIIKDKNIYLIEDAAQSFGSELNNKKACSFGDVAITSFFPAKPLGCYGDGGMIFTNNLDIAQKIRMIRNHGQEIKYEHKLLGMNSRLDTIQAAILLVKFKEFEFDEIKKRRNVALSYINNLRELENNRKIRLPLFDENNKSVYAQFSIVVNTHRDKLLEFFKINKIPFAIYYPKPLHLQPAFSNLGYKEGDFPISEDLCKKIVSLPFDPYKTKEEIDFISNRMIEFFKNNP